jgi:hypothetical protein
MCNRFFADSWFRLLGLRGFGVEWGLDNASFRGNSQKLFLVMDKRLLLLGLWMVQDSCHARK